MKMSLIETKDSPQAIRARLRNPPNAVVDNGINLRPNKILPKIVLPKKEAVKTESEPMLDPETIALLTEKIKIEQLVAFDRIFSEINTLRREINSQRLQISHLIHTKSAGDRAAEIPAIMQIIDIVGIFYDYKISTIISHRRARSITRVRHIAMYQCREWTANSFPEISRAFAARDHSTSMAACRKITELRLKDQWLCYDLVKIDELIERSMSVEAR